MEVKFSVLEHIRKEVENIKPKFEFKCKDMEEFEEWRKGLKSKLLELLRIDIKKDYPLEAEVIERVDCKSYIREKIFFKSFDGFLVPAYILIPKKLKKKNKALLCLHGHGRGKVDVCGIYKNEKEKQQYIKPLNYDYGHQFAEKGYVVLAPDGRCFGETTPYGEHCSWMFTAFLLIGKIMVGLRILDGIRALDYLQSREEIDRDRIGCIGLSWGGTFTLYLSAIDERIKAACISGYFDNFKDMLIERGCCPCQYIPDIYLYADIPDIAGLIAPRPLLIEYGENDPLYTYSEVMKALKKIKKIYKFLKASQNLHIDIFKGAHQFSGRKAFIFFEKYL